MTTNGNRSSGALLLNRTDVAALLEMRECIDLVEDAFRRYGRNELSSPQVLGTHCDGGGFHIKTAVLPADGRLYFAAKTNSNFPENRTRFSLPTIQGVVTLFDAASGEPLALMDSMEITIQRTGAATAVAAKYLARPESSTVTICGCGVQGEVQLTALCAVLPITRCFAFDIDRTRADPFARSMSAKLNLEVEAVTELRQPLSKSDICVTCTTSQKPILAADVVRAGTFVAAVGADNPDKQELDCRLLSRAKLVVDVLEQCATIGELHHALAGGVMTRADVHAELGAVVAGVARGRASAEEITVFDSTGTALQDVAAAVAVYRKAAADSRFSRWAIGG